MGFRFEITVAERGMQRRYHEWEGIGKIGGETCSIV